MKKLTMKKLSLAVLSAACVLGMGAVEAAPKVTLKIVTPVGTAAADKTTLGRGAPWTTCILAPGTGSFGGIPHTTTLDKLQFDIDVTNADDDKDTAKLMDYDLYVFFIDYSTTTGAATGNKMYAVTPNGGLGGPSLLTLANSAALLAALPSTYRYLSTTDFGTVAGYKNTLFGGSISLETATLPQGMWSVLAVMTRPGGVQAGGTLPSPAVVAGAVDPTTAATGSLAIQNPANWAAWSIQPFILGTPFKTATGVGVAGADGAGTCL